MINQPRTIKVVRSREQERARVSAGIAQAFRAKPTDADRFVTLARIVLHQDDVAAARLEELCPAPRTLDDLRQALDTVREEQV